MPKELTPARRGVELFFHSDNLVFTKKELLAKSICGLACVKLMLGGINLFLRARTVLIKPATPAAASRLPTFDFSDPIAQVFSTLLLAPKAFASAATSMESPSGVDEPWAST